jgi:hypothetical protein
MRDSILGSAVSIAVGFIGIATIQYWIPYWIAAWQFVFGLAFKAIEAAI